MFGCLCEPLGHLVLLKTVYIKSEPGLDTPEKNGVKNSLIALYDKEKGWKKMEQPFTNHQPGL